MRLASTATEVSLLILLLALVACGPSRRSSGDDDDFAPSDDDDAADDDDDAAGDDDDAAGDDDDAAGDDDDAAGDDDDAAGDDDDAVGDDDDDIGDCNAPSITSAPGPSLGQTFFSWSGLTPDGSRADVCQMAGQPFLFVMSAGWCGPCNDLASGMAGNSHGYGSDLDTVRNAVASGTLGFVEALVDPWSDYGPATASFLHEWEVQYPNPNILLLGDDLGDSQGSGEVIFPMFANASGGSVPFAVLVGADYSYEALGTAEALAMAASMYAP